VHPIIGVGSKNRSVGTSHLKNLENFLQEYPGLATATIQVWPPDTITPWSKVKEFGQTNTKRETPKRKPPGNHKNPHEETRYCLPCLKNAGRQYEKRSLKVSGPPVNVRGKLRGYKAAPELQLRSTYCRLHFFKHGQSS